MFVFFGTSPRSAKFLELTIQKGVKFDLVVTEPAKLVGKKQILTENPAVLVAKKYSLPYLLYLKELQHQTPLKIGIILDFNKIIPKDEIELFEKGIINIHFSKLPSYRGPAPVQYTILNGDKEAWISYYLITEKLDDGEIIKQTSLALDLTETTEDLYQKLIEKSADEIESVITKYLNKNLLPRSQEGEPSVTKKLKTENCKIDFSKPPQEIERLVRAAYPEPGAWTEVQLPRKLSTMKQSNNETMDLSPFETHRLRILKAHLDQGKLVLDLVQLEGKTPVSYKQFKEGYPEAEIK